MGTAYWSIIALMLGACVGSFLNVVIYRWPRDLSIRRPARSFCPACQVSISWYDNIPILSYLLLRGRCRRCQVPISLQYPLVEAATALVFLMTYDALFVSPQRDGVMYLPMDWPMLLAHWLLWAGLIALSVMDLEAYMVDIRVTWFITAAALVLHTIWPPLLIQGPFGMGWLRPGVTQAGVALAVSAGMLLSYALLLRSRAEASTEANEAPLESPAAAAVAVGEAQGGGSGWLLLMVPVAMIVGYELAVILAPNPPLWFSIQEAQVAGYPLPVRLWAGMAALFIGLVLAASQPQPQADAEIVEAIQSEAPESRRNALSELMLLAPPIVLGIVALLALHFVPATRDGFLRALQWSPYGSWRPVWGLTTALSGWVIGGAIGWGCRIFFTLLFGKEALGLGDVHILAAIGAVAGWPVAFLSFFLAAPLTLLAIVVIRFRRQSRALPYGPWLALAAIIAAVCQDRVLNYFQVRWMLEGPLQ